METKRVCPSCQKTLPTDVPLGLCPECLIKSGFNTGTEPGNPGKTASFVPPPVEQIRKLFPQLEIIELIGQGGMGAVYKARQAALDRLVALKILPPGAAGDAGFAERFNREARALARLNHPHIVAVHDFGQVGGQPYLVMEFVDGPNLRQVEQAGRLTAAQALEIVPQICEALQFAHNEGVVHRDIKPENILLDKKGRVKITDFGIAKILGATSGKDSLTGAKDVVGTPHYMAPEQVEHPQAVDHRADIYSLGVVFYELLTGELPLGKFQPPSKKVQVDVRLDEVVLHTLEKEPERRYQHVSEVKTDVETISHSPASSAPAAGERPDGRSGWLRRSLMPEDTVARWAQWLSFGAALVILVLGLLELPKFDLRPHELFFGILLVLILALVMVVAGYLVGAAGTNRRRQELASPPPARSSGAWRVVGMAVVSHAVLLLPVVAFFVTAVPRICEEFNDFAFALPTGTVLTFRFAQFIRSHGFILVPLALGLDVAICWLVQRFGGRRLLGLWAVIVSLGLTALLLGSLWLLNLPLQVLPTTLRERSKRALAVLRSEPVQEEVQRRLRAAHVEFTSPDIRVQPEHDWAMWHFGDLRELKPVGETNVWTPIQGTLTQRVLPDGSWQVQGEGDLKHIRFSVAATSSPPTGNGLTFGPVTTAVLSDGNPATDHSLIDLDSGKTFTRSPQMRLNDPWLAQNGIDAILAGQFDPPQSLAALNMSVVQILPQEWDTVSAAAVLERIGLGSPTADQVLGRQGAVPKTYLFKTREGGMGVLQFTHVNDNPRGVRIRYKLATVATEGAKPSLQNPDSEPVAFGPVMESVLKPQEVRPQGRAAELLDLDTGRRATSDHFGDNDRETHAWVRTNQLEVLGVIERGQIAVLCFDTVVIPVVSNDWETVTVQNLVTNWHLAQNEPNKITAISPMTDNTDTWLFRTREGGRSIVQILGQSDDPLGVKIRYKLVPAADSAASGSPPTVSARRVIAQAPFVARLADGEVELVALSQYPSANEPWWAPDGGAANEGPFVTEASGDSSADFRMYAVVARLRNMPAEASKPHWKTEPRNSWADGKVLPPDEKAGGKLVMMACKQPRSAATAKVKVGIASGAWETVARARAAAVDPGVQPSPRGLATFVPLADSEAGVRVTVTHNYRHVQIRMIAVESDGSVRGGTNHYQVVSDKIGHTTMTFPGLSLKQAVQRRVEFQFQVRPYHWVEFHNVSLRPGRRTQVEVLDEMRN